MIHLLMEIPVRIKIGKDRLSALSTVSFILRFFKRKFKLFDIRLGIKLGNSKIHLRFVHVLRGTSIGQLLSKPAVSVASSA